MLPSGVKSAHQRVGRQPPDDVPEGGNRGPKITGHAGREPAKVDSHMTPTRCLNDCANPTSCEHVPAEVRRHPGAPSGWDPREPRRCEFCGKTFMRAGLGSHHRACAVKTSWVRWCRAAHANPLPLRALDDANLLEAERMWKRS
jgi:hypothetical protein